MNWHLGVREMSGLITLILHTPSAEARGLRHEQLQRTSVEQVLVA